MIEEVWKDIKGYEGLYQVSNMGMVKSLWRTNQYCKKRIDNIMHTFDNGNGYKYITLRKNGCSKNHYLHRLVAEAFIPNPSNKKEINHLDFDKTNNKVSNLEWADRSDNQIHYFDGKFKSITGERYITYRKSTNKFRFVYKGKEYENKDTLQEALELRKEVLGF